METGCLLHCLEVEETNVFEAVKQSVTTRQAALVYGISVGRNGMTCCPFHDDRHQYEGGQTVPLFCLSGRWGCD